MPRPTLIFDMDNTLLECGEYYLAAIAAFVDMQFERTGIARDVIKGILSAIDLESTKLDRGFGRERFPRSFAAASAALDIIRGLPVDSGAEHDSWGIGNAVFSAPYPAYPGVKDTLKAYRTGGWQLLLCSKGEQDVQIRKIKINAFQRFFDPQNVFITLVKSPEYLQQIIQERDIDVPTSWYIGDSMRDDIGPALKVGMRAVHVRTGTGRWAYENEEHPPTGFVDQLADLPGIIPVVVPTPEGKALLAA